MVIIFQEPVQLVVYTCCQCGIAFALPKSYDDEKRERGGNFFCPNGHSLSYGETEVARLKRALAQERQKLDQERAGARDAVAERDAAKAALLAHQQRVANGVCPCCRRSFADLRRHMRSKHPAYAEAAVGLAGKRKGRAADAPS